MKKIMMGIILTLLIFMIYVVYNHQQNPTDQDVFNATEEWTAPIKDVLLIKQTDYGWFTISKSKQTILLAKLEQNWLGEWELRDGSGHVGTISSINSEGDQDARLIWSASGNQSSGDSFFWSNFRSRN